MGENKHDRAGVSRRDLFQISRLGARAGRFGGGSGLAQTHAAAYQRKVFDEHQWRTVQVLCDLILPADERSGSATQAGVPEFIDDWLDFRKQEDGNDNLAAEILGGLAWLDHESIAAVRQGFRRAPADQQKQILDRIAWPERAAAEDRRWAAFFSRFRDLTVNGFYSSKMGIGDLPYLGNTCRGRVEGLRSRGLGRRSKSA